MTTQLSLFNYEELKPETRVLVRERTDEIKGLVKRSIEDIISIGGKLTEVKNSLDRGQFGPWLKAEFNWSERTARNLMQVHDAFKAASFADLSIVPTALYALASDSVSDEARQEALQAAKEKTLTPAVAEEIIEKHAPKISWGDRVIYKGQSCAVVKLGNKNCFLETEKDGKEISAKVAACAPHPDYSYPPGELKKEARIWVDGEEAWYFYAVGLHYSIVYFEPKKEKDGRVSYTHRVLNSDIKLQLDLSLCPTNYSNSTSVAGTDADSPSPLSKPEESNSPASPSESNPAATSSASDTPESKSSEILTNSSGRNTTIPDPESTSLRPVPPANPSATPESEKEPTTPATVSPQSSESSISSNLNTYASKTSPDSYPVPSDPETLKDLISRNCSIDWATSGSIASGKLCLVASSGASFDASAYYWLPSPGALSAPAGKNAPGQTRLEAHLKEVGILSSKEVLNPLFLEKAFNLPLGWTNPLESRAAIELLNNAGPHWGIALILESRNAPSIESSGSIPSELKVNDPVRVPTIPGMLGTILEIKDDRAFVEWKKGEKTWISIDGLEKLSDHQPSAEVINFAIDLLGSIENDLRSGYSNDAALDRVMEFLTLFVAKEKGVL